MNSVGLCFDNDKKKLHLVKLTNRYSKEKEADFKIISTKMIDNINQISAVELDLNDNDSLEAIKMYLELELLSRSLQASKKTYGYQILGYDKLNPEQKNQLRNIFFKGSIKFTKLQRLDCVDEDTARLGASQEEKMVDKIYTLGGGEKEFIYDNQTKYPIHENKKYYILHKGLVISLHMNGSGGLYSDKKDKVIYLVRLTKSPEGVATLVTVGSARMLERPLSNTYKGHSVEELKEHIIKNGQLNYYKCSREELTLYLQSIELGIRGYNFLPNSESPKLFQKVKCSCLNSLGLDTPQEISDQLSLIRSCIKKIPDPLNLSCKQALTILENDFDLLSENPDKFKIDSEALKILKNSKMESVAKKKLIELELKKYDDTDTFIDYSSVYFNVYSPSKPLSPE
jgi:hypothetical protein